MYTPWRRRQAFLNEKNKNFSVGPSDYKIHFRCWKFRKAGICNFRGPMPSLAISVTLYDWLKKRMSLATNSVDLKTLIKKKKTANSTSVWYHNVNRCRNSISDSLWWTICHLCAYEINYSEFSLRLWFDYGVLTNMLRSSIRPFSNQILGCTQSKLYLTKPDFTNFPM